MLNNTDDINDHIIQITEQDVAELKLFDMIIPTSNKNPITSYYGKALFQITAENGFSLFRPLNMRLQAIQIGGPNLCHRCDSILVADFTPKWAFSPYACQRRFAPLPSATPGQHDRQTQSNLETLLRSYVTGQVSPRAA